MQTTAAGAHRLAAPLPLLALAFAALLLATRWAPLYGPFHDELYYWVGAKRPALGYVDHPPLAPWLLAGVTALFGDGRLAFGLLPALCGAGTLLLAGRMAQRLGAGSFGRTLAGLCVAVMPFSLVLFSFYSVNAIEILLWTAATCLLVELIHTGNERLWLGIGAVAGLGLLNKHTFALLCAGIAVGVVATPLRRQLRSPWLWGGASLALLLAAPNLVWNARHDWPSLAFYRSRPLADLPATVLQALELQLLGSNPANLLVWLPGGCMLLFARRARAYRPLGIAFAALFAVILLSGGRRADRIAGIYPVALAAGAACWDRWRGRGSAGVRIGLVATILAFGAAVVPATLPLLSPQAAAKFFEAIGETPEIEVSDVGQALPLHLSGRLDWESFAGEVTQAFDELSPAEKERAVVLAPHWVLASVVQYYARDRELAPIVAPHNAYWFWRQDAAGRDIALAVGVPEHVLSRYFEKTRALRVIRCPSCNSYRRELPVVLATGPVRPLTQLLSEWRHFGIDSAPLLQR